MFFPYADSRPVALNPSAQRRTLAQGGGLMAVRLDCKEGTEMPAHSHVHEQITYVVAGAFAFTLERDVYNCKAGDSIYVPSGKEHSVRCLKEGALLDVFTPQREDLK